jgi:hypothetical protein
MAAFFGFCRHPGESRGPVFLHLILKIESWIPAFAGMTS